MNERIKELADRILPNEKEFHQGDPKDWGYFFSVDELDKFAELIVTECVTLIRDMGNPTYINHSDWQVSRNDAMRVIREHFGVEE